MQFHGEASLSAPGSDLERRKVRIAGPNRAVHGAEDFLASMAQRPDAIGKLAGEMKYSGVG